ncbi:MAG: hypothetical protein JOZ72_00065 [Alphaproteobacteria bacterium]|nr:hypothetical protein [Alphaproteobacteria bacterium]
MTPLVSIPYVDIRDGSPADLLARYKASALALVAAAAGTYGALGRVASLAALPLGDRASERWLTRNRNPYLAEIGTMAETLGVSGVYLLNLCFEWGCTGGVWDTGDGPLLRRVLDWPFPALGEHLVVAHQKGAAGEFLNATWPGMSGIYQAVAPGRFAAAINQAPSRMHGLGFAGDWLQSRLLTEKRDALPPAHLLRRVFETAPDHETARHLLCETPLAVPAIFILAGTRAGEGCVVERTETGFALRAMADGRVCAANHFVDREEGWRARPIDSHGRLACALGRDASDGFDWFAAPVANANSRLAMTARPASGALALMGTNGAVPATEVFRMD